MSDRGRPYEIRVCCECGGQLRPRVERSEHGIYYECDEHGPRSGHGWKKIEVVPAHELEQAREALPTENELAHLYSVWEALLARAQKAARENRHSGGKFPPAFIVKALEDDAAVVLATVEKIEKACEALASGAVAAGDERSSE